MQVDVQGSGVGATLSYKSRGGSAPLAVGQSFGAVD